MQYNTTVHFLLDVLISGMQAACSGGGTGNTNCPGESSHTLCATSC